jgi:hypothetical protein
MVATAFQQQVQSRINESFERRVRRAPKDLLRALVNETYVKSELWTFGEYAVLAIDHPSKLAAYRQRRRPFGHPFPAFITRDQHAPRSLAILDGRRNLGFSNLQFVANPPGAAAFLGRDTTAFFQNVGIIWAGHGLPNDRYNIGLAYVVGFGNTITEDDYDEALDELIAFHVSRLVAG